ncbi:MAG: tetratricopeptide repeat protein, partial [Gammaproteobacteria bacterium]
LDLPYSPLNTGAIAYALSALPARYVLERRDWASAAALEPNQPLEFPWESAPQVFLANPHYARALGLAHEKRFDEAASEIARLEQIRDAHVESDPYWAGHAEIKAVAAYAWLRFARGEKEEALALMQRAGELEAATDKSNISPGYVLPARELLGDMLLELGMHEEALAAYEATLEHSPERLNSLYGTGLALERMGEAERSAEIFEKVLAMTAEGGSSRPWLARLRGAVASH